MNEKDWYFAKQKLIGVLMVIGAVLLTCIDASCFEVSVFLFVVGIALIVTKEPIWIET